MSKFVKLCFAISLIAFPLITSAFDGMEDGIYSLTDKNGNQLKILILGNTGITIKMYDQNSSYKWGNGDSYPYIWGGGEDNNNNGYSPNPTNLNARQGPCDSGYHVPSAGEWSKLIITWCNLYTGCNSSDLTYLGNLVAITGDNLDSLAENFQSTFNMYRKYWSSTADPIEYDGIASTFALDSNNVNSARLLELDEDEAIRCMKNEVYPYSGNGTENPNDGITTKQDGSYSVRWNNIKLRVAAENLQSLYPRGSNIPNRCDEEGCHEQENAGTNYNNNRGGELDWYDNGFNYSNDRNERQGPCNTGWHVPSRGELNSLVVAWCYLSELCNPSTDLISAYDYETDNGVIRIKDGLITNAFKEQFGFTTNGIWSSSIDPLNPEYDNAFYLSLSGEVSPNARTKRYNELNIRCFKDKDSFIVTFKSDGESITSGEVLEGDTWKDTWNNEIPDLSGGKDHYTFGGWLLNGNLFDFDTPITEDITLTAKWTINQYTISFDTYGGTAISPLTLDYGATIPYPTNPTKNCYSFVGWYNPPTTMPAENITLSALWNYVCGGNSSSSGGGSSSSGGSRSSRGGGSSGGSSNSSDKGNNGNTTSTKNQNQISLSTNKKKLNTDEYINLTIETTNKYLGKLELSAEYETASSGWSTVPNTSHAYFSDYSTEWSNGFYRMVLADDDEVTLKRLLKFSQSGYYRIYVKDTYGNSKYIEFRVNEPNQNITNREIITYSNTGIYDNESNVIQIYQTENNSHYSANETNETNYNTNNPTEDEIYISRSCKSYTIQYIDSLNAYTSPNLKKIEYFVNKDYLKRYIDSKNIQNAECYTNNSRISDSYADTYSDTDRAIAPNGKIYFIEQQNDGYSSKQFSSAKSFASINELKAFINKHNPLTKMN